jgi:hypothetical protein
MQCQVPQTEHLVQIRRLHTRTLLPSKISIPPEIAIITFGTTLDIDIVEIEVRAGALATENVVVTSFGVCRARYICNCDIRYFDTIGRVSYYSCVRER